MERRTPFLAGFVSLIGARRLKPQIDDYSLLNHHGTDNLPHDSDSSVHPACVANGVGFGRDCPCKQFYDDLIKICIDHIDRHAPAEHWNCSDIVYSVWNNIDEYNDIVYKMFLAPNISTTIPSIPVFWAGYSWRLGTRQTMDAILRNISDESVIFRDIEHADTPIGQALRARNWDRKCHASKHDSTLWISLSRKFANGARQIAKNQTRQAQSKKENLLQKASMAGKTLGGIAAGVLVGSVAVAATPSVIITTLPYIGYATQYGLLAGGAGSAVGVAFGAAFGVAGGAAIGVAGGGAAGSAAGSVVGYGYAAKSALASMLSVVLILVNHDVDKLEKDSFLVKHELENFHAFESIVVMDFKNNCSPSLVQMVVSGARSKGQGKEQVVSCVSSNEVAVRHGKEQFSTTDDYRNMVHNIDHGRFSSADDFGFHGRQTRALDTMKHMSSLVKTAGTTIARLEACYTEGIVWRTPLQAMRTSEMTGNRDKDIMECQKNCSEIRGCSHFNVFTSNRTCQLLNRTEELYYGTAGMDVVSGRPNCSKSVEDEERAGWEQKMRERKDWKAMVRIVDVTRFVETAAFPKSQYTCCCDKRKTGAAGKADDDRGINSDTRANYCVISATWKCGSVKVRYDTKKAHNYKATGGTCEILRDDVPALVKIFNAPNYCPQNKYLFMDMEVDIPAAAFHETRSAPCLDGSVGTVTCQIGTPTVGFWGLVQCAKQPSWCPAIPKGAKGDDAVPEVAAAPNGTESFVSCVSGESSTDNTKCTEKGWIPERGYTGWNKDGFPPVCFPQKISYA